MGKGRLPSCIYIGSNGAAMCRCSQPLVGIKQTRCADDEELFKVILQTSDTSTLYIIDARPKANARANRLRGGGFEKKYENCKLLFKDIPNIHAVRDALHVIEELNQRYSEKPQEAKLCWETAEKGVWLEYTRRILDASFQVAELLQSGCSVVVHCSDGWDRTSQITSLALIILDPYFRTMKGFAVLLEKEWLSFGHQFAKRLGHGKDMEDFKDSQRAPIFTQFIDCVWQLLGQKPTSFEFNELFLIKLLDFSTASLFGTFLGDSDCERKKMRLKKKTTSVWSYISTNASMFINPLYEHLTTGTTGTTTSTTSTTSTTTPTTTTTTGTTDVLTQRQVGGNRVRFWGSYYFRWARMRQRQREQIEQLVQQLPQPPQQQQEQQPQQPQQQQQQQQQQAEPLLAIGEDSTVLACQSLPYVYQRPGGGAHFAKEKVGSLRRSRKFVLKSSKEIIEEEKEETKDLEKEKENSKNNLAKKRRSTTKKKKKRTGSLTSEEVMPKWMQSAGSSIQLSSSAGVVLTRERKNRLEKEKEEKDTKEKVYFKETERRKTRKQTTKSNSSSNSSSSPEQATRKQMNRRQTPAPAKQSPLSKSKEKQQQDEKRNNHNSKKREEI